MCRAEKVSQSSPLFFSSKIPREESRKKASRKEGKGGRDKLKWNGKPFYLAGSWPLPGVTSSSRDSQRTNTLHSVLSSPFSSERSTDVQRERLTSQVAEWMPFLSTPRASSMQSCGQFHFYTSRFAPKRHSSILSLRRSPFPSRPSLDERRRPVQSGQSRLYTYADIHTCIHR